MQVLIRHTFSVPSDRRIVKKASLYSSNNLFTLLFLSISIALFLSIVFAKLKQIYNSFPFLYANHCEINNLNCSFYPAFRFQVTWLTDNIVFIVSESILGILNYIRSCEQRNQNSHTHTHTKNYLTHWHEERQTS